MLLSLFYNVIDFIDGVDNVKALSQENSTINEFIVDNQSIYIFFKDLNDIIIKVNEKILQSKDNGYSIPKNSKIQIITNKINGDNIDYKIGFFNGNECDYIYFTTDKTDLSFVKNSDLNICVYKFTEKINRHLYGSSKRTILDDFYDLPDNDISIKKIIKVNNNNSTSDSNCDLLETKEHTDKIGFCIAVLSMFVGFILYYTFAFATNVLCCCDDSKCANNCCSNFVTKEEENENYYFTKTLVEFRDLILIDDDSVGEDDGANTGEYDGANAGEYDGANAGEYYGAINDAATNNEYDGVVNVVDDGANFDVNDNDEK